MLLKRIFQTLVFVFIASLVTGQNNGFIKGIAEDRISFTQNETNYKNRLLVDETSDGIQFVEIGNLEESQSNGRLNIQLPGISTRFTAEAFLVDFTSNEDYVWIGNILDDPRGGMIILTSEAGSVSGSITYQNKVYNIFPLKGNISMLVKQSDDHAECGYDCGTCGTKPPVYDPPVGNPSPIDSISCEFSECAAQIRILGVFDDATYDYINGNLAVFNSILATLNGAFAASRINHTAVMDVIHYNINFEGTNTNYVVNTTASDSYIKEQMEIYNADLVIYFTNQNIIGTNLGQANAIGADENNRHGFVKIKFALAPYYVFTHEIGHLLGAGHQGTEGCNDGWHVLSQTLPNGWQYSYYTIMDTAAPNIASYLNVPHDDRKRILNFSNPTVEFLGEPTGDEFEANNAGAISNYGCTVAALGEEINLSVAIHGPPTFCNSSEIYDVIINTFINEEGLEQGIGPYTYEWYMSFDGLFSSTNPGFYLGDSPTIQIPPNSGPVPNIPPCAAVFIKVIVTSSDGLEGYSIKRLNNCPCQDPDDTQFRYEQEEDFQVNESNHSLMVFPNPTENNFQLQTKVQKECNAQLYLKNIEGKIILEKNIGLFPNTNNYNVELKALPSGLYFLELLTNKSSQTTKIIIK